MSAPAPGAIPSPPSNPIPPPSNPPTPPSITPLPSPPAPPPSTPRPVPPVAPVTPPPEPPPPLPPPPVAEPPTLLPPGPSPQPFSPPPHVASPPQAAPPIIFDPPPPVRPPQPPPVTPTPRTPSAPPSVPRTPPPPPPRTPAPRIPARPPPRTPAPMPSPSPQVTTPSPPPRPPPPAPDPRVTPSPPNGIPISPPSPPNSPSPPPSSSSLPTGTVVGVVVGAIVVLGLLAGVMYCFIGKRRRRRPPPPPPGLPADVYDFRLPVSSLQQSRTAPSSTPPQVYSPWQSGGGASEPPQPPFKPPPVSGGTFSYDDLAAATDGFSDANMLGQGGFGHVYRGTLGGQGVAIKKLRSGSGQGDREFRAEVEIISRVHHKNLVSLVGHCIHGEHRLLVYEYVPNKTLDFHLHGSGRPTLDWPRRWKIALGSAKGLAYLHEDCHPKIIHRDIKAANILLDYNFEPKVADFGLAKFQPGDNTHVSTRVMGTFGYLAPEYATTGKVNDRSDVFSFGVVLLELITGKRPVLSSESYNDETLVSWARPLLTKAAEEDNFEDLIDPYLETNYDAYDMQRLIACAAAAVRHTARSRPRMSQIVRYLEGELSVEDLHAGVVPGQSAVQRSGGTTEQVRRMRRMAFGTGTGTGAISEYNSSVFSEPTSEYGLNPSSSSSGGDTGEMDTRRVGRRYMDSGTAEEMDHYSGESGAERTSRRTRGRPGWE